MMAVALSTLFFVGCSSGEKTEEEGDVQASEDGAAATPDADGAVPATPAPVEAAPATVMAPPAGGAIMYVKIGKAEVKEGPDAGARTVGFLARGDHVYVQVEGAWAKFGDNKFVSTASLTDQGIGRTRKKASWNKGK